MPEDQDNSFDAAVFEEVAFQIGRLADMLALRTVAEFGSSNDRERAVEILKEKSGEFSQGA